MGEYADMAIDDMLAEDEYYLRNCGMDEYGEPIMAPFGRIRRRKDRHNPRRSMKECQFCGKFPLFFHEYEKDKWMLAEWNENNRPVRHVCKLKERLNSARFSR